MHLFRSHAKYFEPAGPVSWDVAMKGTPPDWMVQVKAGDMLDVQATYETKIGSWYESMGIMVVFLAPDAQNGRDPFKTKVDYPGKVTHGHLRENNTHGGRKTDFPTRASCPRAPAPATLPDRRLHLRRRGFPHPRRRWPPATVKRGQSLTYELGAADAARESGTR